MLVADLASVETIAARVHVDYPEDAEVFANRLSLFPAGCFMAIEDGQPLGYCIAHLGRLGDPPPLDSLMRHLPEPADCLYLHDLALLPAARGRRLGAALVARLEQVARSHGMTRIALIAVSNSDGFWQSLGFEATPCAKLASYGQATYRVKAVG
ncbi:MAG: GNAT family N-acetyltransferase [Magnetospirillum sp.]|nr:GNAT family N-acetyltransferase [Magnetospirillum sp.]